VIVRTYIAKLRTAAEKAEIKIPKVEEETSKDPIVYDEGRETIERIDEDERDKVEDVKENEENEEEFPPMYESGDDMDLVTTYKMEASELKCAGDYAAAMEKYTLAIQAASPSSLLLANRADMLLKMGRNGAAVRDCSSALEQNPDSAKALRIRGKAYKVLGEYEKARKDLSASQTIDYDDGAAEDLKLVTEEVLAIEKEQVQKKLENEEKLRKRAEEIREAQEAAKREAEEEAAKREAEEEATMGGMPGGMGGMPGGMGGMPGGMGGMPGGMGGMPGGMGGMPGGMGGMPGGMGGMPGGMPGGGMPGGMGGMEGLMGSLLSDPELAAGMQNPKVMEAFSGMMSGGGADPSKMAKLMSDPEVGPFIQKLMKKLGPMMGGMGAQMPGGMGNTDEDTNEIPDLDDMPDLGK